MNVLDLELFDQAASQLQKALKELDKYYINEKSLANYLDYMADKPLEEWQRFEPKKSESERIALENVSHFGAMLISYASKLYEQYVEVTGSVGELIDQNQKQELEIKRLKNNASFWHQSFIESQENEIDVMKLVIKQIA